MFIATATNLITKPRRIETFLRMSYWRDYVPLLTELGESISESTVL